MFDKSSKDLYAEYHAAPNDGARAYWYACLKTRRDINYEREKANYYLNRIDRAIAAQELHNGQTQGENTPRDTRLINA